MPSFREENRFLIYMVNVSGLYLNSLERITKNKWVVRFFKIWTKVSILLIPIYLASIVPFLLLEDAPLMTKMSVFRRWIAFVLFFFKVVYFYVKRTQIEGLFDLWDSFFREDFYSENREEKIKSNRKENVKIMIFLQVLAAAASLLYAMPPFFSKEKILSHPTAIPYKEQSPDYDLMVFFDLVRVLTACSSAAALDCILVALLSLVFVQLNHLRDCLTDMVNEMFIDLEGNVFIRSHDFGEAKNFSLIYLSTNYPWRPQNTQLYLQFIERFERKMRIWILHHQQTMRFFNEIKQLFLPVYSLQLIFVVFYTCFTALHLVHVKVGINALSQPLVASGNLISLFVWCRYGVGLDFLSAELFGKAHGGPWFLYPKKIKTAFSLILMRGKRPLTLKGLSLFAINLATFFQILKVAYQLFAFMLHVSNEHNENV